MWTEEEATFRSRKSILITGVSGNLGSKVARRLISNNYDVVLIDQISHPNLRVHISDLSKYGPWVNLFENIDIVIHFAGTAKLNNQPLIHKIKNIDFTANVLSACKAHDVDRIIFASSLRVMSGYSGRKRIHESLPLRPDDPFGRSKAHCEEMLSSHDDVICLRLGWVPRRNETLAALLASDQLQKMWLSDRDFIQSIERSIDAENQGFSVYNITSRTPSSVYPLKAARRELGYRPKDRLTRFQILEARLSRRLYLGSR